MGRLFVGFLMFLFLCGILALLTQVDGCDDFGGGGCSSRTANTYDRSYAR